MLLFIIIVLISILHYSIAPCSLPYDGLQCPAGCFINKDGGCSNCNPGIKIVSIKQLFQ